MIEAEAARVQAEEEEQERQRLEAEAEAARIAAEEEAARTKDILLMILPNALIDSNRKLKVSVKEYDELLAEVVSKFELPDDTFLSHVVADGGTPEPLTSLDDFVAKQKENN